MVGSTLYYCDEYNQGYSICSWDRQYNPVNSVNVFSEGNRRPLPQELSINNRGEIVVAGNFDHSLIFGDHEINTDYNPRYMFVAKYGFPCPVFGESSGVFCQGDVYEGRELTQSGSYTFVYPSSSPGVDSIHTMHATVLSQLFTGIDDLTVCKDSVVVLQAIPTYTEYYWSTNETTSSIEVVYNQTGTYHLYLTLWQGECHNTETITVTVVNCQSDITEYQLSNMLLYPNPVTDICRVEIGQEQLERIIVYDMYGRKVGTHHTLDFSTKELSPGIYIVKVVTANSKTGEQKMVKQ